MRHVVIYQVKTTAARLRFGCQESPCATCQRVAAHVLERQTPGARPRSIDIQCLWLWQHKAHIEFAQTRDNSDMTHTRDDLHGRRIRHADRAHEPSLPCTHLLPRACYSVRCERPRGAPHGLDAQPTCRNVSHARRCDARSTFVRACTHYECYRFVWCSGAEDLAVHLRSGARKPARHLRPLPAARVAQESHGQSRAVTSSGAYLERGRCAPCKCGGDASGRVAEFAAAGIPGYACTRVPARRRGSVEAANIARR